MASWRDALVANEAKHGLQLDLGAAGSRLRAPRNPLGDISNRVACALRFRAGKKMECPPLAAEDTSRATNPLVAKHAVPYSKLRESGLLELDPLPTSVDLSIEVGLSRAFSEVLQGNMEDLDAEDWEDPQLCSDYVKDIYRYLRQLEVQQPVSPHYLKGTELSGRMRAVLVDWLVEIHTRFQLLQETLYMSVAIMDRYLQVQPVSRKELQLVGVTAMLLAAKYEEIHPPSILDFVYMTDRAYKASQIRAMEQNILKELNFDLGRPLPLHFLRRVAKVANPCVESYLLAKYLMELTLMDYEMVHYNPSEIAAAALCLAQKVLSSSPWTIKLCYHTGYEEQHLTPVMEHMAKNVVRVNNSLTKYVAVKKKYSSSRFLRISTLPQLNCSAIKDLALPLLDGPQQPV